MFYIFTNKIQYILDNNNVTNKYLNTMQNLKSKRFVVRKSLIGKNTIIEVTFKSGKSYTYNHDKVYEIMKDKLNSMNCFEKYKSYTSSTSIPVILRDKQVV